MSAVLSLKAAGVARVCNRCQKPYAVGTPILLDDSKSGKDKQVGCANCTDEEVLTLLESLSRAPVAPPATPPKVYPWAGKRLVWKEETFKGKKCESCNASVAIGEMVGKWGERDGGNWQIVRCRQCKDLTPAETAQLGQRMTESEATDADAIAKRAGGFGLMWTLIQTAKEKGDTARLDAAVKTFGSWENLYAAMSRLALSNQNLADSTEMSWLGAWDAACATGFLPGNGPAAMAYLVPRNKVISFDLGYKAYHQMGHADGVTVTEHVVWACEQQLGLMARPYREALHRTRGAKTHPASLLGRIEAESNAATFCGYLCDLDDGTQEIADAFDALARGETPELPREVVMVLRSGLRRSEAEQDMVCAVALRLLQAQRAKAVIDADEAEVRAERELAHRQDRAPKRTYRFSTNDVAIVNALLVPEWQGGWLCYDWYYVIEEGRPPLYSRPPAAVWKSPELEWRLFDRDKRTIRHWTATPIGVFAVARWKVTGDDRCAWRWLDIVDVHKRAARNLGGVVVEADGSLSAPDGKSPWATDYYAMVWKTADRALFTSGHVPISGRTQAILAIDSAGAEVAGDLVELSDVAALAAAAVARFRQPKQIEANAPGFDLPESTPERATATPSADEDW